MSNGRSNINLSGNATEAQNLGSGTGVFKEKCNGNILNFKSLKPSGTTISITSDSDNIYISAQTGSGSGVSYDNTPTACNLVTAVDSTHIHSESGMNYSSTGGLCIDKNIKAYNYYTDPNYNIQIGDCCVLSSLTGGVQNVGMGVYTLTDNDNGCNNVGIAHGALRQNTSGCYNIGIGESTLYNNLTGSNNIAIGKCAGCSETGSNKLYIANSSTSSLIYGEFDNKLVCIDEKLTTCKFQMLSGATNGYVLTSDASGNASWKASSGGGVSYDNTATSGNLVTAVDSTHIHSEGGMNYTSTGGLCVDKNIKSCNFCTDLSGCCNIKIGENALLNASKPSCSIAIGFQALECVDSNAVETIGIGLQALRCACGDWNIGIGNHVMSNNNSTGNLNVGIGNTALCNLTTGRCNVAIGYQTLISNCSGYNNVSVGVNNMTTNTTGFDNVAIGYSVLDCNVSGCRNTAIGSYALFGVTADYNVGVGYGAGNNITSSSNNVMVGAWAGNCVDTASNNTIIGAYAGYYSSGSTNVLIGYQAGYNEDGSNKLVISNNSSCFLIKGDFSACTICNGGNNTTWDQNSDCRIKENIITISEATITLSQLNPRKFDYTCDYANLYNWNEDRRTNNYGFIAQEFEQVFPSSVKCSTEPISSGQTVNDFRTMNQSVLIPYLVKAIQELNQRVIDLESKIT